jgi:hypothetical protein
VAATCIVEGMEALSTRAAASVVLATVLVLAGCGGGDDDTTPAGSAAGEAAGAVPTQAVNGSTPSVESGPGGCPTGDAVSAAYGLEMEFNTDFSITEDWLVEEMGGATCQYNQVLAPGATDPSGLDAVAYIATIELIHSDPISEAVGADPVDGVGDAAVWNGAQLSVRAGDRGVRVTNQFPPPGQDGRAAAIALAELALATGWSTGSSATPAGASDTTSATSASTEESTAQSAGGTTECPPADAVSSVWGTEMALDADTATTGAVGLVFCPYEEVIAPGTTDQWGMEPLGDFFSITFTDHNVGDPEVNGGDPVEGIGEQANWNGSALSVWTGARGVIVDVTFPPEGGDALEVAAALAGLALGVDTTGAQVMPGNATPSEDAGDATGCAAPAEVAAALGLDAELALGLGASTDMSNPDDFFAYCPYELADDPFSFSLVVSIQDELSPIDPALPSEDLTEYFGQPATWQDEYHVLLIEQPSGDLVVQITSNDLDIDSREAAIALAEELL